VLAVVGVVRRAVRRGLYRVERRFTTMRRSMDMGLLMETNMGIGILSSRSREVGVGRYGFHCLVDWRKRAEEVRRRKGVLEMDRRSSMGDV
jgi:hypothetical protein